MLPKKFPPLGTVYDHFRRLNQRGVWQQALDALTQQSRRRQGRHRHPSYAIVDSQSVKTQYASDERGIDGGKKIKGRKRHIITDTLGHLLGVIVHAANLHDTIEGYRGTTVTFVQEWLNRRVDIADKASNGFQVQPQRWVVVRTLAWLGNWRRLAKDFEIRTETAENMIRIAMLKITVTKCAKL
jgi:putative transposase